MAGLKHRLKGLAREVFARAVWHTGLHRLVDRWSRPRLLILYGHCVADDALNGALHADMKIGADELRRILTALGRRYDLVTVGEGVRRLREETAGRSMVALSMDDGYRDNLLRLVPLLEETGARATVFLESGAVVDRTLPWLHALGWLVGRLGPEATARRLAPLVPSADALTHVECENRLKRALKYDAEPAERGAALAAQLEEEGADPRAIVDALYLSRDEARALAAADRVEIGGHTVTHPVLARLDAAAASAEIAGGRAALAGLLGEGTGATFAYPYGRPWDHDAASAAAAREAGFTAAVTTTAGVNTADTDPFQLRRWPIQSGTPLHLLGAEASGAFELLRRLGVELVQS